MHINSEKQEERHQGSALEVLRVFIKLGLTSFGGPIAHIGYFHKTFIEQKKWISEAQFAQLLAVSQFLPGPASSQLGFAIGLHRAGWLGAFSAFIGFTLPSAIVLVFFALYVSQTYSSLSNALTQGLKLVACVVVIDAIFNMAKNLCPDLRRKLLALGSAIFLVTVDQIYGQLIVILAAAIYGMLILKDPSPQARPANVTYYSSRIGITLLSVFFLLLLLTFISTDQKDLLNAQVFYQAGALVFGGGHVVLPLLEESVVHNGIIDEATFISGYGAAQAIPGPMFSFAAYLGALMSAENALLGACLALVSIFLPGFILLGGVLPFWQLLATRKSLVAAITSVNAAVVGILLATLYDPVITSGIQSLADIAIVVCGCIILIHFKRSPLWIVALCIATSLLRAVV